MPQPIQQSQNFRPATAKLVARLVAPLLDSGLVSNSEYDQLVAAIKALVHSDATPVPVRLISGQEAAEMLGISYSQFRALESEGSFPFQRRLVGSKTVRYRLADLVRYIEASDVTARL